MTKLRVLGIDPGTQLVGWAVGEKESGGQLTRIDSGVWRLGRSPKPMGERLRILFDELQKQLQRSQPTVVALESAFFGKNARSALKLGEARGVVLVAAELAGVPVIEIPPATIKARVAGAGAASKENVERLVCMHFGLSDHAVATADESDALAIAASVLMDPRHSEATSLDSAKSVGNRSAKRGKLPPGASFQ
ncbi:MAG: crossover junction endodeoxyribonuclease RuvC [Planctomycetes bacterium]|nr:crossover junction endodeoxyribonuclease RuvC [Planctomycetota bacterium]MCP4770440.1 crossover junction endodeoxyribonuclease RuvC [Planctomycetota bacterium]MCP4859880.1 crossover junction endodeoxyribonuclease RuvC [Planctomycetota bacterium]